MKNNLPDAERKTALDWMSKNTITCMDDLYASYQRRVPKVFQDYVTAGSWTEATLRRNYARLSNIVFRQRVGIDISERTTCANILDQPAAMPVALSPVGLLGMQYADGEIKAAQAAEAFGVPFTLSTMSICSIEDVAAHTASPFWFQLYVTRDDGFRKNLMQRAQHAGCTTLVVTLDLQVQGQRNQDLRNGMSVPPKFSVSTMLDFATRLRWALGMLKTKRRNFGNLVGHVQGLEDMAMLVEWVNRNFDPTVSWARVEQIRDEWNGKLVVKGVMDPNDAEMSAKIGADAIVVSNHGGRQLDGAPSTVEALPRIVEKVADRAKVFCDGGVMCGQDVLRLRALGADAAMIGRAYTYGLGACGTRGVTAALELIKRELDLTMAFCGITSNDQIDRSILFEL